MHITIHTLSWILIGSTGTTIKMICKTACTEQIKHHRQLHNDNEKTRKYTWRNMSETICDWLNDRCLAWDESSPGRCDYMEAILVFCPFVRGIHHHLASNAGIRCHLGFNLNKMSNSNRTTGGFWSHGTHVTSLQWWQSHSNGIVRNPHRKHLRQNDTMVCI